MTFTPKQRTYLRSLAHSLSPTVRIGRSGLSAGVIGETNRSLSSHELIKVRLDIDDTAERREMAATLGRQTSSDLVASVGKIAILYRRHPDTPKIKLP